MCLEKVVDDGSVQRDGRVELGNVDVLIGGVRFRAVARTDLDARNIG
jgi:hypothetical protein